MKHGLNLTYPASIETSKQGWKHTRQGRTGTCLFSHADSA